MPIDPFQILDKLSPILPQALLGKEIVALDYDKEADVLYVSFVPKPFAVDSDPIAERGIVMAGLNQADQIVRITILNASSFLY
jgi:uncharacterized protein YuzE